MNWKFAEFIVFNSATSVAGVKMTQASKPWAECSKIDSALDSTMRGQVFSVDTIRRFFSIYISNKKCDDGAYAEGLSDIVCKSLSSDFKESVEALGKDLRMKNFVITHIDATADQLDLEKIKKNADMNCPIKSESLCNQIGKLAVKAIEQIKADDLLFNKK